MTAIIFWGVLKRGPAISIKYVSVGALIQPPEIDNQHRRMENRYFNLHGRVGCLKFEQSICLRLTGSSCTLARVASGAYAVSMHVTGSHSHVSMTSSSR